MRARAKGVGWWGGGDSVAECSSGTTSTRRHEENCKGTKDIQRSRRHFLVNSTPTKHELRYEGRQFGRMATNLTGVQLNKNSSDSNLRLPLRVLRAFVLK